MNIADIESSLKDLVSQPFNAADFAFDLMTVYGAPKATVTKLRQARVDLLGSVSEVHWKKKMLFRATPPGEAPAALEAMIEQFASEKDRPRIFIATDGQELVARDAKTDAALDTDFAAANDSFDFFLPLAGIERYQGVPENPADIKATGRVAKLYDAILEANPQWREGGQTHSLNLFMTRLLFCFFAEDTSIFEDGLFTQKAMSFSREDGSDFAATLDAIFRILNLPRDQRQEVPEFVKPFPYVNGGLFADPAPIPSFSRRARRLFKECGELSWAAINPDIFGSMIQAVVEPGMRGDMGMHYTSVPNIMKALHPLFLLSLEEDFEAGRDSEPKLIRLLKRIYSIRVFDPACGSGNFLIIAYRELRKLESRVFERLAELGKDTLPMTGVQLSQFYGIELADFASETAKLSLWISEYQMNERFKAQFGVAPPALPLRDSGHILHGNALSVDWQTQCPPKGESEIYVVGNPPYLGSSNQNAAQKAELSRLFAPFTDNYRNLDYVAAWYLKAADYARATDAACAFVATNSICQGEQVAMLWPLVYAREMEIGFAHQAFKWRNNASHVAGVTCVIVGIRKRSAAKKILYSGDVARVVKNIGPYLLEMEDIVVEKAGRPTNGLPRMEKGNMPTDDGNLILSPEQKSALLAAHPEAERFVRQYVGAQEFIKSIERYCLWILDEDVPDALAIPEIKQRMEAVAAFRLLSQAPGTRDYAKYPHRFRQIQGFGDDAVILPRVFSETRGYLTAGFVDGQTTIVNDNGFAVYRAEAYVMALLSSRLHAVWAATVCGGLETRIRYSNTMGYHTFPVPALSDVQRAHLEEHAWAIMAAREAYPGATIAWLYGDEMPEKLLSAHHALDATLERICIGRTFKNDTERLEYLFKQYSGLKQKGKAPTEPARKGVAA
jgi:hypothetical protein